jgi:hypothetical protein
LPIWSALNKGNMSRIATTESVVIFWACWDFGKAFNYCLACYTPSASWLQAPSNCDHFSHFLNPSLVIYSSWNTKHPCTPHCKESKIRWHRGVSLSRTKETYERLLTTRTPHLVDFAWLPIVRRPRSARAFLAMRKRACFCIYSWKCQSKIFCLDCDDIHVRRNAVIHRKVRTRVKYHTIGN